MKYLFNITVAGFVLPLMCSAFILSAQEQILWYGQPAKYFEEALPIGNGRMGAMVYGGVHREKLSLNDITLWTGEPINPNNNPKAHEHLPKVRAALFNEDYAAADTLVRKLQGRFSESYAPLGNFWIDFKHQGEATNYKRQLDLSHSQVNISYTIDQTNFTRQIFASHPDQLIVIRLQSKGPDKLEFTIHMNSLLEYQAKVNKQRIQMYGRTPVHVEPNYRRVNKAIEYSEGRGTRFAGLAQLHNTDGKISTQDTLISVKGATYAEIRISVATSFNGYDKDPSTAGKDEKKLAEQNLNKAATSTFTQLLQRHQLDYKKFYDRVKLNLESSSLKTEDTYSRLRNNQTTKPDHGLTELYFNFGRYLLISSSRTAHAPINLQGIWNEEMRPPWSSNYTININTEMNYWPIEVCNLSELHQPLLTFIKDLAKTGAVTAKTYYNCRGWTAHHNTDIWAMTNPVGDFGSGSPNWANWQAGGSWLSTHLWEHYLFTRDLNFLKNEAYPILKGAAQFCMDYLVNDKNGYLVTAPSTSPENIYITDKKYQGATLYGSTSDLAMMRELFNAVITASDLLKSDLAFKDSVKQTLDKLYPYQISKQGYLQEWYHDWNDQEVTHRHLSHLFGVYPGSTITSSQAPLYQAARNSLLRRTNNGTGWSISWKIGMWSRLLDAELAYDALQKLLSYYPADKNETKMSGGGTYPNLFDAHPPFQIDGNFGGIAGIAEMLVQSHEKAIHVLPALPQAWPKGSIKGLKARGNIEVNIQWDKGSLVSAEFKSPYDSKVQIKYKEKTRELKLVKNTWSKLSFE